MGCVCPGGRRRARCPGSYGSTSIRWGSSSTCLPYVVEGTMRALAAHTSFIYDIKCVKPKRGACGVKKEASAFAKAGLAVLLGNCANLLQIGLTPCLGIGFFGDAARSGQVLRGDVPRFGIARRAAIRGHVHIVGSGRALQDSSGYRPSARLWSSGRPGRSHGGRRPALAGAGQKVGCRSDGALQGG